MGTGLLNADISGKYDLKRQLVRQKYKTKQNNENTDQVWCVESVTLSRERKVISSELVLIGKTDSRLMRIAIDSIALMTFTVFKRFSAQDRMLLKSSPQYITNIDL